VTSEPSISYAPRSDTTPEAEASALANVYKFVLSEARHAKTEAAPESRPDAGKEINEQSGKISIPQ
jgi:hypothetical protein